MVTQVVNPFNNPNIKSLEEIGNAKFWQYLFIACGVVAIIGLLCWLCAKRPNNKEDTKR